LLLKMPTRPLPTDARTALQRRPQLDRGARRTMLSYAIAYESPYDTFAKLFFRLARDGAFGDLNGYLGAVEQTHGTAVRKALTKSITQEVENFIQEQGPSMYAYTQGKGKIWAARAPGFALLHMPEGDFLRALELACVGDTDSARQRRSHINAICDKIGVDYRIEDDGVFRWTGDERVAETAVAPAVSALTDPRLAGAATEFEDARLKLQSGGPKDLKDAIDEAAKAVESAMKVVCAEHGARSPRDQLSASLVHEERLSVNRPTRSERALKDHAPRAARRNGHQQRRGEPWGPIPTRARSCRSRAA
jgi:hypothetical protein